MAQLVTPNRNAKRYVSIVAPEIYFYKVPQISGWVTTWVLPDQGLDGNFPYTYEFDTTSGTGIEHSGGYTWDASTSNGSSGDTPSQAYTTSALDAAGNDWYQAYNGDSFETWLMYSPLSVSDMGTVWVPLQKLSWSWTGTATKTSGTWSTTGSVTTDAHGTTTPEFPQWTRVIQADDQFHP